MARVFNDWFMALDGEEQRAFLNERLREEDGREEWEAARDAEERARLEREPELPFPPLPKPVFDDEIPF